MSKNERDDKLQALYSVIDDHASYSVYSIVHLEPLQRLAAESGFPKQASNPYFHAISEIMIGVAKIQAEQDVEPADEKVKWIFDERLQDQGKFLEVWDAIVHDAPENVKPFIQSTPIFRKDDDVRPLQAADLEAWWMRQNGLEEISNLPRLEYPWFPSNMPIAGGTIDEAALRRKFKAMNEVREHLAILDPNREYF